MDPLSTQTTSRRVNTRTRGERVGMVVIGVALAGTVGLGAYRHFNPRTISGLSPSEDERRAKIIDQIANEAPNTRPEEERAKIIENIIKESAPTETQTTASSEEEEPTLTEAEQERRAKIIDQIANQ